MTTKLIDVELRATSARRSAKALSKDVKIIGTSADRTVKSVGKLAKSAVAVAAAIAAATAATVAMVKSSADANRELETMAKLVGITTTEFNALAFATAQYGISADQISDISKDVGEKVAEFAAAGTGAFQDYADVMKLSAREAQLAALEFEKLSGDQVLKEVVKNLEAAGVSGGRVSFVLESLGNDATKLIPLLTKNSAELERLTSGFNSLNNQLSISASESGDLKKVSETFDLLAGTATQAKIAISSRLAPAISETFTDITKLIPPATKALIEFINSFKDVEDIKSVVELEKELARVEDSLERTTKRVEKFGSLFGTADIDNAKERIKELREQIEKLQSVSKATIFEGSGFANADVAGEVDAARAGAAGAPKKKPEESAKEKAAREAAEKAAAESAAMAAEALETLKANLALETQALQNENAIRAGIREGVINAEIGEEVLRFSNKTASDTARFEAEIAKLTEDEEVKKELRLAFQEQQLEEARIFEGNLTDIKVQADNDRADSQVSADELILKSQSITQNAALSLLGAFASRSKAASLAMLAVQKGLAASTAWTSALAGSTKVFADPTLTYPQALAASGKILTQGKIAVGLIAASGLVQGSSIVGGGGIGGGGGGGGVAPAPTASAAPTAPTAQAQQVTSQRVVDFRGLEDGQTVNLNREQLIALLETDDDVIIASNNGQSEAARLGVI